MSGRSGPLADRNVANEIKRGKKGERREKKRERDRERREKREERQGDVAGRWVGDSEG